MREAITVEVTSTTEVSSVIPRPSLNYSISKIHNGVKYETTIEPKKGAKYIKYLAPSKCRKISYLAPMTRSMTAARPYFNLVVVVFRNVVQERLKLVKHKTDYTLCDIHDENHNGTIAKPALLLHTRMVRYNSFL